MPKPEFERTCSEARKEACEESIDSLPICKPAVEANFHAIFNQATCCFTCKRKGDRPYRREHESHKDKKERCTREAFKQCEQYSRVCEPGEEAARMDDGLCCMTCKRDQALDLFQNIAHCGDIDECADGEVAVRPKFTPWTSAGAHRNQCPTCKPPKPQCASKCKKQVCVRSKDGESTKCVGKKAMNFKIQARGALAEVLQNSTDDNLIEEQIRAVIIEVVERYCDQAANSEECVASKEECVDGMVVHVLQSLGDGAGYEEETIDVVIDVPEDTTRRHLLSSHSLSSPATLLENAIADSDSNVLIMYGATVNGAATVFPNVLAVAATLVAILGVL
jgi:hypothetical protein